MKARLNVLGRKLEVVSIDYSLGEINTVLTVDDLGIYQHYHDEKSDKYNATALSINMKEALEFPEYEERIVDERNKLIEHLEELLRVEDEKLIDIAVDAMESDADGLPFASLSLSNWQKEYRLTQQRVLGMIDAIEEVKAYTEGYYADKNNVGPIEAEIDHSAVE